MLRQDILEYIPPAQLVDEDNRIVFPHMVFPFLIPMHRIQPGDMPEHRARMKRQVFRNAVKKSPVRLVDTRGRYIRVIFQPILWWLHRPA